MSMRLPAILVVLAGFLGGALFAEGRHPFFYSSHPGPYYYYPRPYPSVAGPRIVQIGHSFGGFGYSSGYRYRPSYYRGYGPHYNRGYGIRRSYRDSRYRRVRSYYRGPRVYRFYVGSPTGGAIVRANYSDLVIEVKPERALVFIDSKLVGSGVDFSSERSAYPLLEGEYELRIEHPDYESFQTRLKVAPNRTLHLNLELDVLEHPEQ